METIPLNIPEDIDKYFYNRETDIKKINYYLNGLNEDISQHLLITGPLGVGKTFILEKIRKDLNPKFLVTYIDLFKVYSINKGKINLETILLEMLNEFNKVIENSEDYNKLSNYVMNFPQKVIDNSEYKGFVILIDDIQLIYEIGNPEVFFKLIKTYTDFQSNVSYVFTSSYSKTIIDSMDGVFSGQIVHLSISPFTKEETQNYINDCLNLKFRENGFNKFYNCTGGIPAYINTFYNILSKDVVYDEFEIERIFHENNEQILILCIKFWASLNNIEKNILIFLSNNGKTRWKTLLENIRISKTTLSKNLYILRNKGIIKYNKPYYNIESMFKTWILEEKERNGFYPL